MLTSDEFDAIWPLARPLPPVTQEAFLAAVSSALNGTPTVGPGVAYRTARELLPRFLYAAFRLRGDSSFPSPPTRVRRVMAYWACAQLQASRKQFALHCLSNVAGFEVYAHPA